MSARSEDIISGTGFHAGSGRVAKTTERINWTQVWLGGIALGLFTLLIAVSAQPWLVVTGPFMLVGVSRLMGLRSLWK